MTAPRPDVPALTTLPANAHPAHVSDVGERELTALLLHDPALWGPTGLRVSDFVRPEAAEVVGDLLAACAEEGPPPSRDWLVRTLRASGRLSLAGWVQALPAPAPGSIRFAQAVLRRSIVRELIQIGTLELHGYRGAPVFGLPARAGARAVVAAAAVAKAAALERGGA